MKACVIGIGRVGLPLAIYFASKGIPTYGIDIDAKKIDLINGGKMPFKEEGAQAELQKVINKTFWATTDFSKISEVDVIVMTLGTPVDEYLNPVFSQIHGSLDAMIPHLREGQTLILRSTVSPGSTEHVKNYIEQKRNFKVGENLFVAFCPERIAEGKAMVELDKLPEIVGGIDPKSTEKAVAFFKKMKTEVYPTSAINAELLKLFTNMYRYINFAIANEFLVISEEWGANAYEIVELSNKNYSRGGPKIPGFAAGPCLFKDGFFLMEKIPFADLISTSWKINETLPAYLIQKAKALKPPKGKKCVILGLAFKANIDDDRASLSHKVKKLFQKELADVHVHDVYFHGKEYESLLKDADFVVIATAHDEYKKPLDYYLKYIKKDAVVIDVWNVFGKKSSVFRVNDS
ncbi:nucleotide sugar dehydrogenase [Candidatus Micrarchaeota archaeon]|nr:nucleotide sugar dehydrogenase [Candidatus Micrarchaeota archaeon]